MSADAPVEKETTPPDPNTRVVDGAKEFRVVTTRGAKFLLRTLVGSGGWYAGNKEFARRKKLAKTIGKDNRPEDGELVKAWEKENCEFWLSDKLRDHARKCITFFLDKGAISGALDDDEFDSLMIDLGVELKDA